MIEIKKIGKGYAIAFPFELKNAFREQFPSAKWNPTEKHWEVGPRGGPRLRQWVAEVNRSGVIEELADRDQQEMTEKELQTLRAALVKCRGEIERLTNQKAKLQQLKGELQDTRDRLSEHQDVFDRLRSEVVKKQAACDQERQRVAAQLEGAININAVLKAKQAMSRWIDDVGQRARKEFDKAQTVVKAERDKLTALGFYSPALNELAEVNFNRPDRDHPRFIDDEKLWVIHERAEK